MASVTLTWTPTNDASSTGQKVEYRLNSSPTWILDSTVSASASTATISGLTDNYLYSFRVLNICSDSGEVPSNLDEQINLLCPAPVTLTSTSSSISFSFNAIAGNVSSYVVQLRDSGNTNTLDSQTFSSPSGTITGTFDNPFVTPSTTFKVRVVANAVGNLRTYSKACSVTTITTSAPAACNPPSNVIAVMS